jgi:hypothetical protein
LLVEPERLRRAEHSMSKSLKAPALANACTVLVTLVVVDLSHWMLRDASISVGAGENRTFELACDPRDDIVMMLGALAVHGDSTGSTVNNTLALTYQSA